MDMSEVWVDASTEEGGRASELAYDRRMAAAAEVGRKVLESRGVKDIPWTAVEKRVAAADLECRADKIERTRESGAEQFGDAAWREAAEKRCAEIQKQLDDEWLVNARARSAAVEEELRSSNFRRGF